MMNHSSPACAALLLLVLVVPNVSFAAIEKKSAPQKNEVVSTAFQQLKQCKKEEAHNSCEVEELGLRAAIIQPNDFTKKKNDDKDLNQFRELTAQIVVSLCSLRKSNAAYCEQAQAALKKKDIDRTARLEAMKKLPK